VCFASLEAGVRFAILKAGVRFVIPDLKLRSR
jgi:hypothetical protein